MRSLATHETLVYRAWLIRTIIKLYPERTAFCASANPPRDTLRSLADSYLPTSDVMRQLVERITDETAAVWLNELRKRLRDGTSEYDDCEIPGRADLELGLAIYNGRLAELAYSASYRSTLILRIKQNSALADPAGEDCRSVSSDPIEQQEFRARLDEDLHNPRLSDGTRRTPEEVTEIVYDSWRHKLLDNPTDPYPQAVWLYDNSRFCKSPDFKRYFAQVCRPCLRGSKWNRSIFRVQRIVSDVRPLIGNANLDDLVSVGADACRGILKRFERDREDSQVSLTRLFDVHEENLAECLTRSAGPITEPPDPEIIRNIERFHSGPDKPLVDPEVTAYLLGWLCTVKLPDSCKAELDAWACSVEDLARQRNIWKRWLSVAGRKLELTASQKKAYTKEPMRYVKELQSSKAGQLSDEQSGLIIILKNLAGPTGQALLRRAFWHALAELSRSGLQQDRASVRIPKDAPLRRATWLRLLSSKGQQVL